MSTTKKNVGEDNQGLNSIMKNPSENVLRNASSSYHFPNKNNTN